jgi:hypothetical protein
MIIKLVFDIIISFMKLRVSMNKVIIDILIQHLLR